MPLGPLRIVIKVPKVNRERTRDPLVDGLRDASERAESLERHVAGDQRTERLVAGLAGQLGALLAMVQERTGPAGGERDVAVPRGAGPIEAMEQQARFEYLIATLSNRFISCDTDHVSAEIHNALEMIGEFSGIDRIHVFQFSGDRQVIRNTHQWFREGCGPVRQVDGFPVGALPWIMPKHERGEIIHIPRVADLPPEAEAERRLFEAEGIRSILCVPLACAEKVLGFVVFNTLKEEKSWSDEAAILLRLVGEILANALERKRAKEELEDLARFPSEDPNPVLRVSADGWVLYSNQAGSRMLASWGHQPGRPLPEPWRRMIVEAMRSGKGEQHEIASGRKVYSTTLVPVAALNYVNLYALDVTERKAGEEALRTSEANYREIFDAANDAIFVHDLETGEILDCNRKTCEMYGLARDEVCRGSIEDLSAGVPPYTQDDALRWVRKATEGEPQVFEWLAKGRRGEPFWVEVNLKRARIGGRLCLLAVVRDIRERKRVEEERRELEVRGQHAQKLESLGVLAGGIAHDFNNLLMAILGNADLALLDLPRSSPVHASVAEIKTAAIRASELTGQMLAYSGRGQLQVRPLDLNHLVEDMSHLLEVSRSKKITLKERYAEALPAVVADAAQIHQVVMNLITNASDAIGEQEGTITIRTGVTEIAAGWAADAHLDGPGKGGYVFLEVSDTGCGMAEETQARIFDPFFTTKFTGRGLGLAAVLGIVRGHRGAIEIDSEVGKGTTFRVLLPVSPEASSAPAPEGAGDTHRTTGGTILLVDDEESVRNVGKAMLERGGFTVLAAADGREAVEVFRLCADGIDAVLLDMTMPGLNGREALRAIHEIRRDVPILLCSGYGEQDATRDLGCGSLAGFIQKPYQLEQLLAAIRGVLNR